MESIISEGQEFLKSIRSWSGDLDVEIDADPKALIGEWQIDLAISECPDRALELLGVGRLKRSIIKRTAVKTRVERVDDAGRMRVIVDGGRSYEVDPSGAKERLYDGRFAEQRSFFDAASGALIVLRYDAKGEVKFVEARWVLKDGRRQLFRWLVREEDGQFLVINRWLKKLDGGIPPRTTSVPVE